MHTFSDSRKHMVKSGSKGNPLILRVADESKAQLVAEVCFENDWQFIVGIEPDQEEDLSDLEKNSILLFVTK